MTENAKMHVTIYPKLAVTKTYGSTWLIPIGVQIGSASREAATAWVWSHFQPVYSRNAMNTRAKTSQFVSSRTAQTMKDLTTSGKTIERSLAYARDDG